MRFTTLLAAGALALLSACASKPPAPPVDLAATASARSLMVASLATNRCEEAIAPEQTRAIVGVNAATRAYQRGQISGAALRSVIDAGQDARDSLAAACKGRRDDVDQVQLDRGRAAVQRIATILGGR